MRKIARGLGILLAVSGIIGIIATSLSVFSPTDSGIVFEIGVKTLIELIPGIFFAVVGIATFRWGRRGT